MTDIAFIKRLDSSQRCEIFVCSNNLSKTWDEELARWRRVTRYSVMNVSRMMKLWCGGEVEVVMLVWQIQWILNVLTSGQPYRLEDTIITTYVTQQPSCTVVNLIKVSSDITPSLHLHSTWLTYRTSCVVITPSMGVNKAEVSVFYFRKKSDLSAEDCQASLRCSTREDMSLRCYTYLML